MHVKYCAAGLLGGLVVAVAGAQEREDRTLLPPSQMTAIINEASGERAMHHVLDLVPYQFVRPPSEYQGHFREAEVMARLAKEYGFSNIAIEDFPQGQTWQPTVGELWMTAPKSVKLFDIHDIPEVLASTSVSGDISGELIDVGLGRPQDFDGKDVTGKFVLSLSPTGLGAVYSQAVAHGAIGAMGASAIGAARATDYPNRSGLDDGECEQARHGGVGALAENGKGPGGDARPRRDRRDSFDHEDRAGAEQAGSRPR